MTPATDSCPGIDGSRAPEGIFMNPIEFYNLSVEMRGILAHLEETGDALTPELEARLDALGADTSARVAEMALACRELDRSASAVELEKDRLAKRARSWRNRIDIFRHYMTDHMADTGTPRVSDDVVTVSLVEGEEQPFWEGRDENIPEVYRRTTVEHRLNKDLALLHRAEGVPIPEGIRFKRSKHIRIT